MTTVPRFKISILGFALALTFAPAARADVEYWSDLLDSVRDAGAVRVVEIQARTPLNERPAELSADILGPVADLGAAGGALVWQLGGLWDDGGGAGGAFGLHYRFPPSDGRAAGINAFADYYRDREIGAFWRWSAGGEYRSPWVDIFANYYVPADSEQIRTVEERDEKGDVTGTREVLMKIAEGYDAEFRLHSPDLRWLSVVGGWANWDEARVDGENRRGMRYGIRLEPTAEAWDSFRLALLRDESRPEGRKTRVDLSLYFVIGEGWEFARASDKESARMHFLPAERERRPFLREAR